MLDHTEIVLTLAKAGANVNKRNDVGATPTILSAYHGNAVAVRALLEAKANPNVKMQSGETAMYFATQSGRAEIVSMLKDAGAK